jgi:hypothetical protein
MSKSIACRLGWHKWVTRATEDGGRFKQCARCATMDEREPPTPSAGLG